MTDPHASSFIARTRQFLDREWKSICDSSGTPENDRLVPTHIRDAVRESINSKTKTYRYVLPTQLLAKSVDSSLDSRSVQVECGLTGPFDARSLCHKVIVPFDRANHNVLGGSSEPYVNNPLRIPAISASYRQAQKNKVGFDLLCTVLDFAQAKPNAVRSLFRFVLQTLWDRLGESQIVYPVPNRVSFPGAKSAITEFVRDPIGGVRLQTTAAALFRCIGDKFRLFKDVRTSSINAPDAATGRIADLECLDESETIVLGVEIKDRQLTLTQTQDKLPAIRAQGVREFLFLVQNGISGDDDAQVRRLIDEQFATGQNLYVCEFGSFLDACLILLGEDARRSLLTRIGEELDAQKVDLAHRQAWQRLMQKL